MDTIIRYYNIVVDTIMEHIIQIFIYSLSLSIYIYI